MKNIVLFASGGGSNAEKIMQYFSTGNGPRVAAVFTNKATAGVIEKALHYNVRTIIFTKEQLFNGEVVEMLTAYNPSLIVLAGFLLKFPEAIVKAYPNKIINIHPALLPKYGGKGMYGMHVHKAVLHNKEPETGITIHYVNENYDEGAIIAQHIVSIDNCITPEEIALKVQELEHEHFAETINRLLDDSNFR